MVSTSFLLYYYSERAPRDLPRRNRTQLAPPSAKSRTVYAGRASQPHASSIPPSPTLLPPRRNTQPAPLNANFRTTYADRASKPHTSPIPPSPSLSTTPSTPEFDLAQLELDLPSPILDSDSFWDLNSTAATDTDWDDESTAAATGTGPSSLEHALKHEDSADIAPVQLNLEMLSPVTTAATTALSPQDNKLPQDNEPLTFAISKLLSLVATVSSSNDSAPNVSRPDGTGLERLRTMASDTFTHPVFAWCACLTSFLIKASLLYVVAALIFSDVLGPEELRPDILDVIRRSRRL